MAEALLVHEGAGRFEVASAGATPAMEVDPMTFEVLDELGVNWRAHRPKGYEAVQNVAWDIVITVCDRAREMCPVLPGKPVFMHWSIEDPVEATGPPPVRRHAFMATARRIHASVRRFAASGTTTR
jgi:arsenate reductase